MNSFSSFLLVGAGGLIGSILRYLTTLLFRDYISFPYGTLVANVSGCFLIGVITGLSAEVPVLSTQTRLFLATGICGGFTTLSSLIYELGQMFRQGQIAGGSLYFLSTFTGAFLSFFIGMAFIKLLYRG